MTPQQYQQVKKLFAEAIELPELQRADWVRRNADEDSDVCAAVLGMLDEEVQPHAFAADKLEGGGAGMLAAHMPLDGSGSSPAALPQTIGRYRIKRIVAQGGMGLVYEAEQDAPKRRVALKEIRSLVASPQLLARFQREAEVLGQLQHPGIAHIYESGIDTSNGQNQPFFAMEFIDGEPINQYAAARELGHRERFELIARVCDAVQHAHQKGVIHRDLKPANILVVEHGTLGRVRNDTSATGTAIDFIGQPKILDFGIARVTNGDVETATLQTEVGQIVGTLAYMSPEQVAGDPLAIDTRTDVYAIGVVLFELLAGRLPLDISGRNIADAARVIQDTDPARISSIDASLRGDVDTIIAKAIDKDRERRYASVAELAADLRRVNRDEPILARPASTAYQIRKFARRNKGLVAGILVGLIALIAGMTGAAIGLVSALNSKANLEESNQKLADANIKLEQTNLDLKQVAEFQSEQLSGIDLPIMGEQLRALLFADVAEENRAALQAQLDGVNFTDMALAVLKQTIIQRSLAAIDRQFSGQPLVQARLLQTAADTSHNLGLYEMAIGPQNRAIEIRRRVLGDEHPDTLTSINNMGVLLCSQDRFDEAERFHREALTARRRLLGNEDEKTLSSINNMSDVQKGLGNIAEADRLLREALETSRRVLGQGHPQTIGALHDMGVFLVQQGKPRAAEPLLREAIEANRRVYGSDRRQTLTAIHNLGILLRRQGRPDEAEPLLQEVVERRRRVLGDHHPQTITSINNLAYVFQAQGRLDEAEVLYREALATSRRVIGNSDPQTLASISNLGHLMFLQNRRDEAETHYREAVERGRRALGADHPQTLTAIHNLGNLLKEQGRFSEAEPLLRESIETGRRVFGDGGVVDSIGTLGSLLEAQGRWQDAEEMRRLELDIARRGAPAAGRQVETALGRLGMNLLNQARSAEAEPLLAERLSILRSEAPADDVHLCLTLCMLGQAVASSGSRLAEAERLLVEAADRKFDARCANVAKARLVKLYDDWHAMDPEAGHDVKARQWEERLTRTQVK